MAESLDPLNWNIAIVDPNTGHPTAEFIRKWTAQRTLNGTIPSPTTTFLALTDTPGSYVGAGTRLLAITAGENGIEFVVAPTSGINHAQVMSRLSIGI